MDTTPAAFEPPHAAPSDGTVPAVSAMLWTMAPPEPNPRSNRTTADGESRSQPDPADLRTAISENEWRRVTTFRDPAHAWSSAATRALLRAMLSRYHGADPMDWHFLTEPGGRPHVDMARLPHAVTVETRPRFSLSHTRGLAACMVSLGSWPAGAELGVDVEFTRRTLPAGRLAARFFHPDEAAALTALERGAPREDLFLTLWTRKESVLKALGLGIANHLALYACLGEPGRVTGPPEMIGASTDWRVVTGNPTPVHRLSWAVHWPASPRSPGPWQVDISWHHISAWPP